jgi:chloramphenicol-sensitive protein RarD
MTSDRAAGRTPSTVGVGMGIGAYGLWGLFPAFFPLLEPASATEILGHRMVWTLVFMLILLTVSGRLSHLRGIPLRTWAMAGMASMLIAVNWGVYIYAVNSGHVVEASLGYFITPLLSVALGVVVLREGLGRWQLLALGLAVCAVVVLTVDYGRPPFISLTLAASFGMYGLIKKTIKLDPRSSLTAEGLVLAPLSIGYLVWLQLSGASTFTDHGAGHAVLLLTAGLVTALPLLLFGAAAQRIPLVTLGVLQYLTPVLQLAWGLAVVHEAMPPSRWLGFAIIWVALVIFTIDLVVKGRRSARLRSAPGRPTPAIVR